MVEFLFCVGFVLGSKDFVKNELILVKCDILINEF